MNTVSKKELLEILSNGGAESLELIDVRQPEEYREWHFVGAKLIPLGTLDMRLDEIDWTKKVIFICRSGARSGMATNMATSTGKDAYNLIGGMMDVESDTAMHRLLEK